MSPSERVPCGDKVFEFKCDGRKVKYSLCKPPFGRDGVFDRMSIREAYTAFKVLAKEYDHRARPDVARIPAVEINVGSDKWILPDGSYFTTFS